MRKKFPHNPEWDTAVAELEAFFATATLPEKIQVADGVITDPALYVEAHLRYVKAHHNNPDFLPYRDRLRELITILSNQLTQDYGT